MHEANLKAKIKRAEKIEAELIAFIKTLTTEAQQNILDSIKTVYGKDGENES